MSKDKIIYSLIWKFLERGGTQVVQFIIQVVLARLLMPEDYGIIAIVMIFISIANVFVQNGFNTALIQKKMIDNIDLSSVFFLNLFVALILYIIIFFVSPFIAKFYDLPIITNVFRILSLTLFFGAINSIQQAIVARKLQFKRYFLSSLVGIIISAFVGIVLAYNNYGVWSLVFQQLSNTLIITIVLWFTVKWRPNLSFSITRVKSLFSFGWKILCSSLIDTIYNNIYDLVIGKKYSSKDLAFYNKGKQFPSVIIQNMNSSISSVMLPVFSKQQDNKDKLKKLMRRSIVTSSYIVFPISIGLIVVAKPLIITVLTEKWINAVVFLQLLAMNYAFWPIHTSNLQAINSLGKSDIYLKLEIIKKILGIIILIITIPMGLIPMAIGQIVTGIISTFINAYPNKKLLNYSYFEQIKDILPSLLISIMMGLIISLINLFNFSNLITLILQVIFGIIIYVILSVIFKLDCFLYLFNTWKSLLNSKFRR